MIQPKSVNFLRICDNISLTTAKINVDYACERISKLYEFLLACRSMF